MREILDEELMVKYQQGNIAAFDLLFCRYRARLFSFILRMLNRDRASAEDLLQEVFSKLAQAREMYEPRAKFSTWIYTITRNHCLNFIKSRQYLKGRRTVSLDAEDPETGVSLLDSLPGTDSSAADRLVLKERVEWAISTLPTGYREVFLLHAVDGFSHQQTACILSMSPATVRTQYHRARNLLRKRAGDLTRKHVIEQRGQR